MSQSLLFILRVATDIFVLILLVRALLQLVQADFYNPISQTVFKICAPVVEPLRKVLPTIGHAESCCGGRSAVGAMGFLCDYSGHQWSIITSAICLFGRCSLRCSQCTCGNLFLGYFYSGDLKLGRHNQSPYSPAGRPDCRALYAPV